MEMEQIRKAFRNYDAREICFDTTFLKRGQRGQTLAFFFEDSDDYVTSLSVGGIRIEDFSAMALWAKTLFAFLKLDGFVNASDEEDFSWVTIFFFSIRSPFGLKTSSISFVLRCRRRFLSSILFAFLEREHRVYFCDRSLSGP